MSDIKRTSLDVNVKLNLIKFIKIKGFIMQVTATIQGGSNMTGTNCD